MRSRLEAVEVESLEIAVVSSLVVRGSSKCSEGMSLSISSSIDHS